MVPDTCLFLFYMLDKMEVHRYDAPFAQTQKNEIFWSAQNGCRHFGISCCVLLRRNDHVIMFIQSERDKDSRASPLLI